MWWNKKLNKSDMEPVINHPLKQNGVPKNINPPPPPPIRTKAERLHDSYRIQYQIEELIMDLFEKLEPEIYNDLDFGIGSDDYDNSIEIYFRNPLPYPYEPSHAIRKAIYDLGFSIVYWNFTADKQIVNGRETCDEIRGYEPRHVKEGSKWIPGKYGYVDDRFNEQEWLAKYGPRSS